MKSFVFSLIGVVIFSTVVAFAVSSASAQQSNIHGAGGMTGNFKMQDVEPEICREIGYMFFAPGGAGVRIPDGGSILIGGLNRLIWIMQTGHDIAALNNGFSGLGDIDAQVREIDFARRRILCDNSSPAAGATGSTINISNVRAFDRGYLPPLLSSFFDYHRPDSWTIIILPG